jgi:ABC-type branched-subunit amino acid transport system substrate-binding protein
MLSRFKRGTTIAAATTLALAMVTVGTVVSTAGASGTPGVTDSSVTIGATVPFTGPANNYLSVSGAAAAVFKYVNAKHHGINGRTINYIRMDDCYDIQATAVGCASDESTAQVTAALLSTSGGIFATVGSLGTTAQSSVKATLKADGVPQLFVNSGDPQWNDAASFPGLFGFQTSYISEGKIMGAYIKAHYGSEKVGFIGQSDFGPYYLQGLEDEGVTPVNSCAGNACYYDITGSVNPIMTSIQNSGAQVVFSASIPQVTNAIFAEAKNLTFSPKWLIASVGSDPLVVKNKAEAGALTFDFFSGTTVKSTWNTWLRSVLTAYPTTIPGGFKKTSPLTGNEQYGAAWAVAFLEALHSLGTSTSNITQANLVSAISSTHYATNALLPLVFSSSNHQGLQGGIIATIAKNGTKAPVTATVPTTGKPVELTTDSSSSAITTAKVTNSTIPTYIK